MVADIKELKEIVSSLRKQNMELKVQLDRINQKEFDEDNRSLIQNGVSNVVQSAVRHDEQKIPDFSTPTNKTDIVDEMNSLRNKRLELCSNGGTLSRFPAGSFKTL